MSQRERPAPRGPAAAPRPGDQPVPAARPSRAAAPPWDDLYDLLPPEQRTRLLALAAAQGVLHAEQVPAPVVDAPGSPLLSRLLAGDGVEDLPPLDCTEPCDGLPDGLDPRQRAAVAAALRTPDLYL